MAAQASPQGSNLKVHADFRGFDNMTDAFFGRIFDALPQEVAVLDEKGVVVAANARWAHGGGREVADAGENLLEWLRWRESDDPLARLLLDGIEAVVAGGRDAFSLAGAGEAGSQSFWASIEVRALPAGMGGALLLRNCSAGPGHGRAASDAAVRGAREAELLSQRNELEYLYQNLPVGLCLLDLNLRFLRVNRRLAEMNGLPVDAHIGRALREIVPALAQRAEEIAQHVAATKAPMVDVEFAGETLAEGDGRFWNTGWHPFFDDQGAVVGFSVVVEETTERKRAEQAVKESEQRERRHSAELQALLDTAPIGLSIALDPDGARIRGNRALEQIFGVAPGREFSKTADNAPAFKVFRSGKQLAAGDLPMQRAIRGEAVGGDIVDVQREDGGNISVFAKAMPLFDELGNPRGAVGAFMDITKLRRAEDALRASEERFRSLVEAYAQAVWETDAEGVVVTDSPSWRAYTGQTRDEMMGWGWLDALHPDDRRHAWKKWRDAVASKGLFDAEYRLRKRGAGWRWTNVRATPILGADGKVLKWTGMNIDIDAHKRAEAALRESEARYRALFEEMDEGYCIIEVLFDGEGKAVDYRFLEANPAFEKQSGLKAAVGRTVREFQPNLEPRWFASYGDVAVRGQPKRFQDYSEALGRYFDVYAFRVGAPGEHKVAVLFSDVTERKIAENALRESETRLEQALAAANAGVWQLIPAGGAFNASDRAMSLHGLEPGAPMDYDRALAAVYEEDRPDVEAALTASIEKGAPFKVEYRAPQPDGTFRWLSSIAEARGEGADTRLLGLVQDIDERKRSEVALRESEERQAFLLKLTDALRRIVDPGEIQAAACRLLGEYLGVNRVSYADIEGEEFVVRQGYARGVDPFMVRMPVSDLGAKLIESYRRGETVAITDVFAEEGFTEAERERFKAGQIVALASVILSKQGRWVGTLCAHHAEPRSWRPLDIGLVREVAERIWSSAERARALAALRVSEFRLQLALRTGKIGIYEVDVERRKTIWDDRLRVLWGLPPNAPVSYGVFMRGIHPGDRASVKRALHKALDRKGQPSFSFECRVLDQADGSERWVAATGAVFFEEGRPVRVVGTAQDITARKLAEEERQKFVSLAEQSMEFIGICNLDYEPLYINPAGAALVGLDRAQGPKHVGVADFFFPEDQEFVGRFFQRVRRDGHANVEIRFRHFVTGGALWMSYNVFVLRDQRGEPIGYATVSRDITERRRVEEALRAADRRKDEFLATLAHELRNPLAPIRNAVHVLRHDAEASKKSTRDLTLLAMVYRQAEHLVRLVDDLLEVSRITRGKIELKKQRVALADILAHAMETAQPLIDRAGHRLHVTLPAAPIEVEADPVRLAQVFTNLLNNAAKYTEPAGDIWLSAERRAGEAAVTVRDNGVGVPVEMLPRIFDLFTQVDRSLGRAQGGLGIGLALVKSLLELHGGTVEAQSEGLGHGAAFVVHLPVVPEKMTEELMPATASTKTSEMRRILVIDDDHDVADSLVMFLETFGATVQVAYSGAAGLETLASFKPDLIFLDLGMPGMDGYETARRIRALPEGRDVQLVALTGWGQEQVNDRARAAGFDRQLTKPAGFEALQELLGSL